MRFLFAALLLFSPQAFAQMNPTQLSASGETPVIRLWEGRAPFAQGNAHEDIPTLTLYRPTANADVHTAVIVAPGGGYQHLSLNQEGRQVANWLNTQGITAFVLEYRLGPKYHHPVELGDAARAVRLVRSRAAEFGVRADRVGMMGFSAGGHLTASVSTRFEEAPRGPDPIDRLSARPDFAILAYPVISMQAGVAHAGSVRYLLGENPTQAQRDEMSVELHVSSKTPPTFIYTSEDDKTVPVKNSMLYYEALLANQVPAELHVLAHGLHGAGLGPWTESLVRWLGGLGVLSK